MKLNIILLFVLTGSFLSAEEEWRNFRTPTGQVIQAQVLSTDINGVNLLLKDGGRELYVTYDKLIPADLNYVRNWTFTGAKAPKAKANAGDGAGADKNKQLYPYTWEELEEYMEAIKDRDPKPGEDFQVQKAVNELNLYRLLCGVSWKVLTNDDIAKSARNAAKQFVEEGENSKEIDAKRDDYLWKEDEEDMEEAVKHFIADDGRENMDTLPMRSRILSPGLTRTGFGMWEDVVAMRVGKPSNRGGVQLWSYPGRGYFPNDYLHGDSWSCYLDYKIPDPEKVTVKMWELASAPNEEFDWDLDVPGEPVRVYRVAVHENAVHFQPAKPGKKSIYWIRVEGTKIQEQYLVHFY